jgi:membrane protein implicated in regulation of membrane protease activity
VTLTVFVLAIIVASLVTRWRLTVGAVFVTAAAVVLVLNVRELRRRQRPACVDTRRLGDLLRSTTVRHHGGADP